MQGVGGSSPLSPTKISTRKHWFVGFFVSVNEGACMDQSLTIIRSQRRTLALHVDLSGTISVRAPYFTSDREIQRFVDEHWEWAIRKQAELRQRSQGQKPLTFTPGEELPYLGRRYRIELRTIPAITLDTDALCIPHKFLPHLVVPRWLKSEAHRIITERVRHFAAQMQLTPSAIRLSGAKTRWGSCSPDNTLSFTWRLIHCPLAIIDYVVVHELGHMTHKNHSRAYWVHVNTILPDYKVAEAWLKKHAGLLNLIR